MGPGASPPQGRGQEDTEPEAPPCPPQQKRDALKTGGGGHEKERLDFKVGERYPKSSCCAVRKR